MPKIKAKDLTFIDLFAGCGGLSLGLEQAGFFPLYVNELNKDALETYMARSRNKELFPLGVRNRRKYFQERSNIDCGGIEGFCYVEILINYGFVTGFSYESLLGGDCISNVAHVKTARSDRL